MLAGWTQQFFWNIWTTKELKKFLEELKAEPADDKLRRYKSNLQQHVRRMNSSRMAKIMLNCGPNGRRRLGRPLERLLDEAETGLAGPDRWRLMMIAYLRAKYFERSAGYTLFDHKKKWRNFGSAESRKSWRQTKRIQIKFATTCNKNEQQQDGKNNVEL